MNHVDPHLPWGVVEVRRELCETCPTPCDKQRALEHYGKAASSCPLKYPRWRHYGAFGLGDLVAAVAQPIAGAIDAVAGTQIQSCGGCAKRREMLNRVQL